MILGFDIISLTEKGNDILKAYSVARRNFFERMNIKEGFNNEIYEIRYKKKTIRKAITKIGEDGMRLSIMQALFSRGGDVADFDVKVVTDE